MKIRTGVISFIWLLISAISYSAPLSGTYTIGGSSPTYSTLSAAASDLVAKGVSGRVVFNIRSGIYNEHISITTVSGASASNRITFQSESGNANDVTITYTAVGTGDNYVISVNGSGYFTFRNLTVTAVGATYAKAFALYGSPHDSLVNNIISNGVTACCVGTSMVIDAWQSPVNSDDLVVCGNQINGGSYGLNMYAPGSPSGPVGLVVENNSFNNNGYMAINLAECKNAIIRGNTITNLSSGYGGIIIWNGCDGLRILGNKITAAQGVYIPSAGLANNPGLIANNFIYTPVGIGYGLYGINTTNQVFYHNSVITTNANGYAFVVYGGSSNNVIKNNIFYNAAGGVAISTSPAAAISASDYNDFYTSGSSLGSWNGPGCANLAAWTAASGMDSNSRQLLPPFTSATDLHLTTYSTMDFGTLLSEVTTDIDDNIRSLTDPVVGADDMGVINPAPNLCCSCSVQLLTAGFAADHTNVCAGSTITFSDTSLGDPTGWAWTFTGGSPGSSTSKNPAVTFNTQGLYDVKLVVSNGSGKDSITLSGYITVLPLPEAGSVTADPDTICSGSSSQLRSTGSTAPIQWQSSADGLSFTDIIGDTLSVNNITSLSNSTYYRVQVNDGCGTDSTAAIKLLVNTLPTPIVTVSDTLICSSDSAQFCTSVSYASYLWNTTATGACIQTKSAAGYWVTVTDANGCSAVSDHKTLLVYPPTPVTIVAHNDTLASVNAVSYQWLLNDTAIDGATLFYYVAHRSGDYSVEVTDTNGCKALSNSIHMTITGIATILDAEQISIFPNPAGNTVHIINSTPGDAILHYRIANALGLIIGENKNEGSTLDIDISSFSSGLYFIYIRTRSEELITRLIKE